MEPAKGCRICTRPPSGSGENSRAWSTVTLCQERVKHDLLGGDGSNRGKTARRGCGLPQAGRGQGAALGCEAAHRRRVARQVALFRHRTGPILAPTPLRSDTLGGGDRPAFARPAHLPRQTRADGKRLDLDLFGGLVAALVSGPTLFRVIG